MSDFEYELKHIDEVKGLTAEDKRVLQDYEDGKQVALDKFYLVLLKRQKLGLSTDNETMPVTDENTKRVLFLARNSDIESLKIQRVGDKNAI